MVIDMAVIVHDACPDGSNNFATGFCYQTAVIGKRTKVADVDLQAFIIDNLYGRCSNTFWDEDGVV